MHVYLSEVVMVLNFSPGVSKEFMSQRKLIHALYAEVCVLKAGSAHEEYRPNIPLPSPDQLYVQQTSVREQGKSSTMFLGHVTWGFSKKKKKKPVGQGYTFSFFIQAFLEVSKHQIHVNHVYMCCVHKEQSYISVILIHYPYIISLSFFSWHTAYVCVCISVLLGDTVFLEGLVLLLSARQHCSTFSGLSVPPTQPLFLVPLRRVCVHDILRVRSNKICYRQLIK